MTGRGSNGLGRACRPDVRAEGSPYRIVVLAKSLVLGPASCFFRAGESTLEGCEPTAGRVHSGGREGPGVSLWPGTTHFPLLKEKEWNWGDEE